jgi:hypothetical protein
MRTAKTGRDTKRQKKPKKGESTRSRQLTFLTAFLNERFCIAAACRAAGIHRATFYRWEKSERFRRELDELKQEKIDLIEVALYRNIQSGDPASVIFALKTIGKLRGYIESERVRTGEAPPKQAVEILDELLAGTIDAVEAGLKFARAGLPLPEALRLLLSKTEPPPREPDVPPSISDEELEAEYQKKMAELDAQEKNWLPARREEVRALKEELKGAEAFAPGAEPKKEVTECQS